MSEKFVERKKYTWHTQLLWLERFKAHNGMLVIGENTKKYFLEGHIWFACKVVHEYFNSAFILYIFDVKVKENVSFCTFVCVKKACVEYKLDTHIVIKKWKGCKLLLTRDLQTYKLFGILLYFMYTEMLLECGWMVEDMECIKD